MYRLFAISEPLVIVLAMPLRIFYDGVSVLDTDGIIQLADSLRAAPEIPELPVAVKRHR